MPTLLAFHSDPAIKAHYLARIHAHRVADELVQGYGYWKDGKGCAIGCTLHGSDHSSYPREVGIPEELAYLEDALFEGLPVKHARAWPERLFNAIEPGADLSRVYDLWSAWNLTDPEHGVINLVSDYYYPDIHRIVRETAADCLAGKRVDDKKLVEAADAAQAAEAARAMWAAWAARAASAWWAPDVARAAWAAWVAWDARSKYYIHASDALIELVSACKVA